MARYIGIALALLITLPVMSGCVVRDHGYDDRGYQRGHDNDNYGQERRREVHERNEYNREHHDDRDRRHDNGEYRDRGRDNGEYRDRGRRQDDNQDRDRERDYRD